MVATAVATLSRRLYSADPSRDLTVAERDTLVRGGFDLAPGPSDGRNPLARTIAEYAALLKTSKSVSEVARLLGVNPSRIRQRLNARPPSIYGIKVDGEWRIPGFLLDGRHLVRGIDQIVAKLDPELHPVSFYHWFTTPNPDLEAEDAAGERPLSPRDWLLSGHAPEPLAELASHL